ncbi:MAG: glucose sorbosone dehydrogenase [Phycisphaerales bacterium]|nr:glucose sorbosone dehydrogenase [Phycisphaerales bacterium]
MIQTPRSSCLAAAVAAAALGVTALGDDVVKQAPVATSETAAASIPDVRMDRVWPQVSLRRPVQLVARPDRSDRLYVVEQAGRVIEIDSSDPTATGRVVLDIKGPVQDKFNEQGLLSLVFHPKFKENRFVYVWYTTSNPDRNTLGRLQAKEGAEDGIIDPESLTVLLEIADPAWNHNGGTLLFGSDGLLYLSTGDGGAGNDPWGNGQNLESLLASVLRIDIDHPGDGKLYGIPADNPFVGRPDARGEKYATGLRNVWRMSFDRKTGELYGGDVGQNAFEEIDIIVKGGNYGWRPREGLQATPGVPDASQSSDGFVDPIVVYPRSDGVSVTGGFVYRGTEYQSLQGVYLYADYEQGTMWGLRAEGGKLTLGPKVVGGKRRFHLASFGEANDGTLFVCGTESSADGPGSIYRLSPAR